MSLRSCLNAVGRRPKPNGMAGAATVHGRTAVGDLSLSSAPSEVLGPG